MEMAAVHGRDHEHLGLGLGLGLGLSLGIATVEAAAAAPQQRALAAAPPASPSRCAGVFFPAACAGGQERARVACHEMPFLRGIDVNRAPAGAGEAVMRGRRCGSEDEEPGASSPNSTLSSLSGKRCAPARSGGGVGGGEGEHDHAAAASDDEDSGAGGACGGGSTRKKLRLSKDQSAVLEDSFKEHSTLNPKQKAALARQLGLRPRQVEVWFQNRRARTKLKQTEVDCEALKRCCETLTEENRRLQREVHDLRALKLLAPPPPHHLYMRLPPPTTLTMCPSCERVASSPSSSSGKPAASVAGGVPSGPWGTVPVRPVFVDRPAQRS